MKTPAINCRGKQRRGWRDRERTFWAARGILKVPLSPVGGGGRGAQEPALPISRLLLRKGSKDDLRRSGWDAEDVARSRVVQSL